MVVTPYIAAYIFIKITQKSLPEKREALLSKSFETAQLFTG